MHANFSLPRESFHELNPVRENLINFFEMYFAFFSDGEIISNAFASAVSSSSVSYLISRDAYNNNFKI